MKRLSICSALLLFGAYATTPALADRDRGCSIRDVAGNWVFATSIGEQMLAILPPGKNLTAIGTMNISRDGSLEGTFDLTVEETAFNPGIPYWGSISVNKDCTGSIEFTTPISSRTDSIVIVNRREMIGMSQDPLNVWTYQVRRISGLFRFGRDDD